MTDKEKIKALTRNLELACRYINQSIEHHGDNLITMGCVLPVNTAVERFEKLIEEVRND